MYKLGQYHEAIECCNLAIKYEPYNPDAYHSKGMCLDKLGQYHEAIENFDLAIKYEPYNPDTYNNKGVCVDKLGHIKRQ
ncbi:tetratricopeptide repeat family protein [Orientia tsutsugamushi str. TA763]|nr:tetratricopeptide repeat family protein [Orientia tsutsugamushi str. TA763]